ncbi:MAG: tRNA (adenosine(37)-N6)-dimethylallyltransferase MiaA, partial [Gemmatimonadota bacterium]|nr:tRNA (adenosine(37)-N6)-dimethylallyltransferase MiaA [Gemmatimonadota bacterium]
TASGKTALAIEVARELDGEIISLDSRQAYRGFAIGTAAPTAGDLAAAPHHGVGFLDPDERYGAGRFAELARRWIEEIEGRGRVPILAGGTGLFLRALTHPLFREPEMAPERRRAVRAGLDALPAETLVAWAERLDPALGGEGSPDAQRAARTVELCLASGRPLSWWVEHGEPVRPPHSPRVLARDLTREVQRERIERRTAAWLASGAWAREVRRLASEGRDRSRAFDALGYRDILDMVEGRLTEEQVRDRVVGDTWAYARRQRTWFRHQLPSDTRRLDGTEPTPQLAARVAEAWRAEAQSGRGSPPGPTGREPTGRP